MTIVNDTVGQQLRDLLAKGKILPRDEKWANIIASAETRQRYLSPRQAQIGNEILSRARSEKPATEITYGTYPEILSLFRHVQKTLKWPKLFLRHADSGISVRIAQTRTSDVQTVSWNGERCGILKASAFQPNYHCPDDVREALVETLSAFDADYINNAKVTGVKFGACCFCGRELTNKISVYHGWGPICAEKWGLPWEGETPEEEQNKVLDQLEQNLFGG